MNFYVYILKSAVDRRFYIGQTQDLAKRLLSHNQGKSTYTKKFLPWNIYAYKLCDSRVDALNLEKKLKNLKSTQKLLAYIEKNQFHIEDSQEVTGPEK